MSELDIDRLELDAEKLSLTAAVIVFLGGLVIAGTISLEPGTVVQAILSPTSVSNHWAGVSGQVTEPLNETAMPVDSFYVDDARTGSVHVLDMEGVEDGDHYFASLPFYSDSFERNKIRSINLEDLESGGLFSEDDFPVFYPNESSYSDVRDNPANTFEETENITLLGREIKAGKTELDSNIEYYLAGYNTGGDTKPLFLNKIQSYEDCYDGNSCSYQFMLPQTSGEYSFYMLPQENLLNVTVLIDDERKRSFPFSGRPYNLTIRTSATFENNTPEDTEIRITEKEGNNIFTPAISSDYSSEAQIITRTVNGETTVMYSPTKYNSPEDYSLSIDIYDDGEVTQTVPLEVENNNIEFTDKGPVEKGFDDLEDPYKRGVNRLRPIASCMFGKVNSDKAYRIDAVDGESYELVRGIPYVVNASAYASYFSLEESGSHLVMGPGRVENSTHLEAGGRPYGASENVVFTPTLSAAEDDSLSVELLDSQGDLLGQTNLSVKDATCDDVSDGEEIDAPELTEFKKRVNAIRPVLNSLFVAGA